MNQKVYFPSKNLILKTSLEKSTCGLKKSCLT